MIEIAISLAVIAFALVAIIGVLPLGLEVQRENREETIINHDAGYFMDVIRNGSRGADDLTNYVFAITNFWSTYQSDVNPWVLQRSGADGYDWFGSDTGSPTSGGAFLPITNGFNIIGLLSRPKFENYAPALCQSNHTVAYVRAMSGPASEKFPQADPVVRDIAFSYRLIANNVQVPAYDTNSPYGKMMLANSHEVRLLFRWPLLPNWTSGNGHQTYRALAGGQLETINAAGHPLHFFRPTTFTNDTASIP